MIPLIQCNDNDANRYYRECLVFFNNQPHMFLGKEGSVATLCDPSGREVRVQYNDVRITIIEPFYTKEGEYYGHQAGRRTSRGIMYPRKHYGDIVSMLQNGDVPTFQLRDGIRINKDFRTQLVRGLVHLMYRGDCVGFVQDNEYYVIDNFISERLAGVSNGISVSVIPK